MKFDHPTLITLTAPTCSGKSFLLSALTQNGSQRIVSTTTRSPRKGEKEGVDYNFISREHSLDLEEAGLFAELIEYNGVRYGVTHAEMERKMVQGTAAPVVIVTPEGVEIYREYCRSKGWDIFAVYIHTQQSVCLDRLNKRTVLDLAALVRETPTASEHAFATIMRGHTNRVLAVTREESTWITRDKWDAIIPGDNAERALKDLQDGIAWRNKRLGQQTKR